MTDVANLSLTEMTTLSLTLSLTYRFPRCQSSGPAASYAIHPVSVPKLSHARRAWQSSARVCFRLPRNQVDALRLWRDYELDNGTRSRGDRVCASMAKRSGGMAMSKGEAATRTELNEKKGRVEKAASFRAMILRTEVLVTDKLEKNARPPMPLHSQGTMDF